MLFQDISPFRDNCEGIEFLIKVSTKASKNAIGKWEAIENGQALKIFVTAVPEKGKANQAILNLLSEHLGISKSELQILKGLTSPLKTIGIIGNPKELRNRLRGRL